MVERTLDDTPEEEPAFVPTYDGNKPGDFWTKRLSRGAAGRSFKSAVELMQVAGEYFNWAHTNELKEEKAFFYKGEISKDSVNKMRVFTQEGFCVFAGISDRTYRNYREDPELSKAVEVIDQIIKVQKFEGAAAGMLNPMIIARDLGLAEKQEVTGSGGGPLAMNWGKLSTEALAELAAAMDPDAQPKAE